MTRQPRFLLHLHPGESRYGPFVIVRVRDHYWVKFQNGTRPKAYGPFGTMGTALDVVFRAAQVGR